MFMLILMTLEMVEMNITYVSRMSLKTFVQSEM